VLPAAASAPQPRDTDGDPETAQAAQPSRSQPATYASARRRGQPIAVLLRSTALRSAPGGDAVATLRRRTEFGSPTVLATVGQRGRWLRVMAPQLPNGGTGWIRADAAAVVASPWSVRADLSRREVEVRRNGRVVRRFAVAIGKPTTPTPPGRFAVTDKLRIGGGSRAYGCCALALSGHQPHIEPGWRGGDRLAIHGTSSPATIGFAASFGCLRASERDVRWVVHNVELGSVVEIAP
jgi:lipoprotein-anchoring transpeptidase ErfK/SrfK